MNLLHVGRYFRDSRVPTWRKLVGVAAVAYVLLPIDLIPDVIPVVGWLDDLGVITLALGFLSGDVSRHAKRRTANVEVIEGTAVKAR